MVRLWLVILAFTAEPREAAQPTEACLQAALQLPSADGVEIGTSLLQHAALEDPKLYSLYVKFHKVGSSTFKRYVDAMSGLQETVCGVNCGFPAWLCTELYDTMEEIEACAKRQGPLPCPTRMFSCTDHAGLGVMAQATIGQNITVANPSDLAAPENLYTSSQKLRLLYGVQWARAWLPQNMMNLGNKRILVTTLLREPAERMRSMFYYPKFEDHPNPPPSHEQFKDFLLSQRDWVAGNMSEVALAAGGTTAYMRQRLCCEYILFLGQGENSIDKAKTVLATQFDLVGITERMSEALVSLGRLYGFSPEKVAGLFGGAEPKERENSARKLDWTSEEKELATYIVHKSTPVYNFANELFDRRSLESFGSKENLQKAAARFEASLAQR